MLGFLRSHPYVFTLSIAVLTAGIMWIYSRTIEKDKDVVNKTFNKTLLAGVIAAMAMTWLVYRQEPICSEPFTTET